MGSAMLAGVSGLNSHQRMLDVAGNNLANVNTFGFKASRVIFSELLSETLRQASEPTGDMGGTNPMQVGSGAGVASVDRIMTSGGLVNTGQDLDMAIEGEGYFVLSDGESNVYSRVGAFAVDSDSNLVDPATGYLVQRTGTTGEADGFQTGTNLQIPVDKTLAAKATENVAITGNLSGFGTTATTNMLLSGIVYTENGDAANESTLLADLDQVGGTGLSDGDTFDIAGTDRDGSAVTATYTIGVGEAATATLADLMAAISGAFSGATTGVMNGQIQLEDDQPGFSKTDLTLAYTSATGTGTFELPGYFRISQVGAENTDRTSIKVFDSEGTSHTLSLAFAADGNGVWDLVITSLDGVSGLSDRRIEGITFKADGSYGGIAGTPPDDATFGVTFSNDPALRVIAIDLGTVGQRDGLTYSSGESKLAGISANWQNGYAAGTLDRISVTQEGVLTGIFSNGLRRDLASLQLAVFKNPAALSSLGGNYFAATSNSGIPQETSGRSGGAGAVVGGALEQSNVAVASEFVNLIRAQNGFQANARTIKVANDMLRELSNLIR